MRFISGLPTELRIISLCIRFPENTGFDFDDNFVKTVVRCELAVAIVLDLYLSGVITDRQFLIVFENLKVINGCTRVSQDTFQQLHSWRVGPRVTVGRQTNEDWKVALHNQCVVGIYNPKAYRFYCCVGNSQYNVYQNHFTVGIEQWPLNLVIPIRLYVQWLKGF